jgi:hypothetical protein
MKCCVILILIDSKAFGIRPNKNSNDSLKCSLNPMFVICRR